MKKRVLGIVLIIVLLVTPEFSVLGAHKEKYGGEVLQELYGEGVVENEVLTPEMEVEKENTMKATYIDNAMKVNEEYSEYYGGVYLKNGELVVKLTDTESQVINFFENTFDATINYEKCNAALKELEAINEYILSCKLNLDLYDDPILKELLESIVMVAIGIEKNAVSVGIKEYSAEKVELFKKYILDSEHIIFVRGMDYVNENSNLNPGQLIKIKVNGTKTSYSMGFRCKKLYSSGIYMYGFVTAAHYYVQNGNSVYVSTATGDIEIGHVQSVSYVNGGTVDAAFVQVTNANYDCTNTVYSNGTTLIGGSGVLTEGGTVAKAGATTGGTTGTVLDYSISVTAIDGKTIRDLYEVSYGSDGGDSGGIVYSPSTRLVAGIHKGNSGTEMYPTKCAVKVANIKSALGVSLY